MINLEVHSNRLIHETSPYLLQHATNPVDWYPWGDEAFEKAKQRGKPVLLSIGYSACHWCHVMAHESFENEVISKIMNDHFINIKVDREERPDLDQIYQSAVQFFIRRGGGWPLTMFLTPEKVPFHGGTYFPPEDRFQLPGFPKILLSLAEAYRERPDDVAKTAKNVLDAINHMKSRSEPSKKTIDPNLLKNTVEQIGRMFDTTHGGFGEAPKFPSTPALSLFLRYDQQSKASPFLEMACTSLRKMAWGGLYDQFAGGFHRYSVDKAWQVPHFEKMLYDNAQLVQLYFSAYQATKDPFFQEIGIETLEYILGEMTDKAGGFYASQDADSEGGEGSYYTWSPQEVVAILGKDSGEILCRTFEITDEGNFEGKTIPHRQESIKNLATQLSRTEAEIKEIIRFGKQKLLIEREKRPKPFLDKKIITSWNSLMISGFISGFQVTRHKKYLSAAVNAADFILSRLYKEGKLLHTFKDGIAKLSAYLDDVSYFANALLDLYEATTKETYLLTAKSLSDRLITHFWDAEQGGFYYTPTDHEPLIDRIRPSYDQSLPSGNAIAAQVLLRLFYHTGEKPYFEKGEKTLLAFASEMGKNPFGVGNMIAAADFYLKRPKEIHLAGNPESAESERLLSNIHQLFLPNKVISFNKASLSDNRSWIGEKGGDDKLTVSICQNFSCSQAMTAWEDIRKSLLDL